ncbi:MAG: hypothetical protein FWG43_02815 [Clostridiales bacterium]|nr:hypothetical protein [Clostridiales bacterium]
MKKFFVVAVLIAVMFAFASPALAADFNYFVYFNPSSVEVKADRTFDVEIWMYGDTNYWQVMAEFTYDPDILICDYKKLVGHVARFDTFVEGKGSIWTFPYFDIVKAYPCDKPIEEPNGGGVIKCAVLTFKVKEDYTGSWDDISVCFGTVHVNPAGNAGRGTIGVFTGPCVNGNDTKTVIEFVCDPAYGTWNGEKVFKDEPGEILPVSAAPTLDSTTHTFIKWIPAGPWEFPEKADSPLLVVPEIKKLVTITFDDTGVVGGHLEEPVVFTGPEGEPVLDYYPGKYPPTVVVEPGYRFVGWEDEAGNLITPPTVFPDKNIVIKPRIEKIVNVKVTFINDTPDLGSFNPPSPVEFEGEPGTNTPAIEPPTTTPNPGYKFNGWDITPLPVVYPATNLEIHGSFVEDPILWSKIFFVVNDPAKGSLIGKTEFRGVIGHNIYEEIEIPTPVPAAGCVFVEWSPLPLPTVYPPVDTTYTATFKKQVTITFDDTGVLYGKLDPGGKRIFTGVEGTTISDTEYPPTALADLGYKQDGWVDGAGNPITLPIVFPTDDLTIKPKFIEDESLWSKIFFVVNDPAKGSLTGETEFRGVIGYNIYQEIVIPTPVPATGCVFVGWSPLPLPIVYPTVDTTYTATFKREVTVTFVSEDEEKGTVDGAVGNVLEIKGLEGDPLTAPGTTRVIGGGYEFDRWEPSVPTTFPDAPKTYTAMWKVYEPEWSTVTFYINYPNVVGPELPVIFKGIKGRALPPIVAPLVTLIPGYDFAWDTDPIPNVYPETNMVINGVWKKRVTVTFVSEDVTKGTVNGAVDNELKVTGFAGEPLTVPGTTRKTGYVFDEWLLEEPVKFPDVDTTYTATWKKYDPEWTKVTFVSNDLTMGTLDGVVEYGEGIIGTPIVGIVWPTPVPTDDTKYEFEKWSQDTLPTDYPDDDLEIIGYFKSKMKGDEYNIYFGEVTNKPASNDVIVDIMLWSEFRYYQVSAIIAFDPNVLEITEYGYDYLKEHVAHYDNSRITEGIIEVWSFTSPDTIQFGVSCDPAVVVASLLFSFKAGVPTDTDTKLSIRPGSMVLPPGIYLPPFPNVKLGPDVTVKKW